MNDLANENFIPESEKGKDDPVSYEIKPLSQIQLAELLMDYAQPIQGSLGLKLNSAGAMKCLTYGLVNADDINRMKAVHIISVSSRIFERAVLSQEEQKN